MDEADHRMLASSAAKLLDLRIDPALLDAVADNLALLQAHARQVMQFELSAAEEIACVFRA
jgi:hypothetical protein